ncbi:hypothetical protein C8R47DRAFT_1215572 [Mycena vitilis]|nr:hypothetical protein C8R47DRAFT_1215572 [Mycena vitilis]
MDTSSASIRGFPDFNVSHVADSSHIQEDDQYEPESLSRGEELRRGFYKDDDEGLEDDEPSLVQQIILLSGKMTLEDHEIVDEGVDRDPRSYRFRVAAELLNTFAQAAFDLQWYLKEAALANPKRTKYFKVDPGLSLIPSLEGSSDPQQLRVAWDLLRARFELGRKFFDKYVHEIDPEGGEVGSPTSTRSSIIDGFESLADREQKLRHLVTYYPHHKDYLPTARERLQSWGAAWGPLYNRRASSTSPQREDAGARSEQAGSEDFYRYANVTHRNTGKQRESWPDSQTVRSEDFEPPERNIFSPIPAQQSVQDLLSSKSYPSPSKTVLPRESLAGNSTLLGRSPKFKSSTSFLDQMANQSIVAAHAVPEAKAEPNILKNLGAGPSMGRNDLRRSLLGEGGGGTDLRSGSAPSRYSAPPSDSWRRPPETFAEPGKLRAAGHAHPRRRLISRTIHRLLMLLMLPFPLLILLAARLRADQEETEEEAGVVEGLAVEAVMEEEAEAAAGALVAEVEDMVGEAVNRAEEAVYQVVEEVNPVLRGHQVLQDLRVLQEAARLLIPIVRQHLMVLQFQLSM